MVTNPQDRIDPIRYERPKLVKQANQSVIRQLKDVLWEGWATTSILWNYRTKDWVTNVIAVDFDNDGDIEVVFSSREGNVRVHTAWGAKKWEYKFAGHAISALYAIPVSTIDSQTKVLQSQACVIVGTRDGNVFAIDQNGKLLADWHYSIGRMIRQIYSSKESPDRLIIGSEDRCIHIVDRRTGRALAVPYKTNGWVRSVDACTLNDDTRDAILAGSGDNYLYILNNHGRFLDKLFLGHQIYALFAARLYEGGPITVITSSNRKDLFVWTVQRSKEGRWVQQKEWSRSPDQALFGNRIHSIYVDDVNNDHEPEIILGAEDGYLYILTMQGQLLWRHQFASCIYSTWVMDINYDGQKEILIGTEDSGVFVVQLQISDDISARIRNVYNDVLLSEGTAAIKQALKELTPREKATLNDFVDDISPLGYVPMEVDEATHLVQQGQYEQALQLFLHSRQQHVQHCWPQPMTTQGYIWTLGIGQIEHKGQYALIVGTDEGYIYAIDVAKGQERIIWKTDVINRVRMLQITALHPGEPDSIVAILSNHRMVILNAQGEIVKEQHFQQEEDWARCVQVDLHPENSEKEAEILIGLENNKIAIWDADIEQERRVIHTPQGISILTTYDLKSAGTSDIIAGSINGEIYVYNQAGTLQWKYEAQDRILALYIADIDRDGSPEIIFGSEDRNVYVLDNEGHMKWRYRTARSVCDISVSDTNFDNEAIDPQKRKLTIIAGSADGNLYVISAHGDLLWQYKGDNRVKAVRAGNITGNGKIEIAIASGNRLELLQVIDTKKLMDEEILDTWRKLLESKLGSSDDTHGVVMEFTHHPNEYMRAFALAKLAGQRRRYDEDTKRFQDAISKKEDSTQVKKELVRSIIVLQKLPTYKEENTQQARRFLSLLAADPDPNIRLEIISIFPRLIELNESLCFEYVEYFTHNIDPWVRRAVIRQLDPLTETYAERAFKFLLTTLNDDDEWVRQETGRALSHYFDAHPENAIHDSLALINARTRETILEQISYSAHKPIIKQWFLALTRLLHDTKKLILDEQRISEMIEAITGLQEYAPLYGDDYQQVYTEFKRIWQIRNSTTLARYQWVQTSEESEDEEYQIISICMQVFNKIKDVAEIMRALERREEVRDRVTTLLSATDAIEAIRNTLKQQEMEQREGLTNDQFYQLPEFAILAFLVEQIYQVVKKETNRLRGSARLVAEIFNKEAQQEEQVTVSLLITNKGESTADSVHVTLVEAEQDFKIIGKSSHRLFQVQTKNTASVEFTIAPMHNAPRLKFTIVYDDAERRAKQEDFADIVILQDHRRPYMEIPNPYTSGTPIRSRKMFYGRRNDIDILSNKLSSVTANKVVILSGQRRMGKTSLVYQLANELMRGPQVPVLIDLQGQAMQTMGQLFSGIAQRVREEVEQRRALRLPEPDTVAFENNPIASFDAYMAQALQTLQGEKLVFLLDEFEVLQEKINKGPLNQDVLHYLRSLMQHREGLNFLLVGAPRIRDVTEPYWSIFFNIALQQTLKQLEPAEADALITEPVREYLEYDMLALERMHWLSGNLPYFIHVLSESLINYCNTQNKTYVTVNDINKVLDTVLEEQSVSIKWIWDQTSDPLAHFLLSILAEDRDDKGRTFTLTDIYTQFEAQGIPYEQDKVLAALRHLKSEAIIEEQQNGLQYRLPVGLIKEWLRRIKPPERVIRDEFPYSEV